MNADVVVIGGGLAGLATGLALRRHGITTLVVDDGRSPRPSLGESLEFTAPVYLTRLGLDADALRVAGVSHPKTNVHVELTGSPDFEIWPTGWMRFPPFFCSPETVHIDRVALDVELHRRFTAAGGRVVTARVARVVVEPGRPDRVRSLELDGGTAVTARWFVDASGHRARVLVRALGIRRRHTGDARLAYFGTRSRSEAACATRLSFSANHDDRIVWGWQIPLPNGRMSVGASVPGRAGPRGRASSRNALSYAGDRLASPHDFVTDDPPRVVGYRPSSCAESSGPNWVLVGDAAALVDPITSGGVAAACRGALSASDLIAADLGGASTIDDDRAIHHHAAVTMVETANLLVDRVLHRCGLRRLVGLRLATFSFALANVVSNAWFVRLRPRDRRRLAVHRIALVGVRSAARTVGLLALPGDAWRRDGHRGSGGRREPAVPVRPRVAAGVVQSARPEHVPVTTGRPRFAHGRVAEQ